jgi:1-acyl-sn-glycerol-3-phosphate acyltransferase
MAEPDAERYRVADARAESPEPFVRKEPAPFVRKEGDLVFRDAGHGYDVFGMTPKAVRRAMSLSKWLYEWYFRVSSHGVENVPSTGAAILAANHSGTLPIDGALIVLDVVRNTHPARVPRAIGDVFIPLLPWFGTLLSRVGMVSGTRSNFRYLLNAGELVLVFPEGVTGMAKGLRRRYRLEPFRVGHAELALRHRVPVIPVAVIGAEEAWPAAGRVAGFHAFGAPFLPLPLSPLPLPVRHAIYYGRPLLLHERYAPEDADDPEIVVRAARDVQDAVEELIERGLGERRGLL